MDLRIAQDHCRRLTREQAKNFYYAFLFLPEAKQRAAFALYAFCRAADDIVDGESPDDEAKENALDRYEAELEACLAGEPGPHPVFVALAPVLSAFPIPPAAFRLMIRGMRQDLTTTRYPDFASLEAYCYQVASSVALMLMPVFDPERADALAPYARSGGIAVQLTNVLRDVAEDAALGRIYLPLEDLARFGVSEEALLAGKPEAGFRELMAFEADRARAFHVLAEEALTPRDRQAQRVLETARLIYRKVLDEIVRRRYDVLGRRISLSPTRKLAISIATLLGAGEAGRRAAPALRSQ